MVKGSESLVSKKIRKSQKRKAGTRNEKKRASMPDEMDREIRVGPKIGKSDGRSRARAKTVMSDGRIRPRPKTGKPDDEVRNNIKNESKIAKKILTRALEPCNGKLPPHKKDESEQFDDYVVFADSSAWLPYLVYDEKDDDPIRKRRARIMDSVIDMKKGKISTTKIISYEVTENLKSGFKEKSAKAIERYKGFIGQQVRDVGKSGSCADRVSDMYKKICSEPENSEKIDAWSMIKTKHKADSELSWKEWNKEWETFPKKDKVKWPPEGADIVILATIYKYRKDHMPTTAIFVTLDSDFAFFKKEIEDELGIVVVTDVRYTGA